MMSSPNFNNMAVGSRDNLFNMIRIIPKGKSGLKLCHLNAQSLNNKMEEFRYIFEQSDIDVVCVSETWFVPSIHDSNYNLRGYRLFRADRDTNAGGVAIFVKSSINCKLKRMPNAVDVESENEDNVNVNDDNKYGKIEQLFIEIFSKTKKLLLGVVYRPNKRIKMGDWLTKLTTISMGYSDVILVGDFNNNILVDKDLMESMISIGLQLVNSSTPTHFTKTTNTLLDLCFINKMSSLLLFDQLSASLFSKHDIIVLVYDFDVDDHNPKVITYRDFRNIDYQSLETDLCTVPWNEIFYMPSVDEQIVFLHHNITVLYEKYIRLRKKIIRCEHPWFSNEIKLLIEERNSAYTRWKRFKTDELHAIFKILRRKVNAKIKIAKSKFYEDKFKSAVCSKKKWKEIKNMGVVSNNNNVNNITDVNRLNHTFVNIPMPDADVNHYNDLFTTSYSTSDSHINNSFSDNNNHNMLFEFIPFTQEDVLETFLSIKSNSVGHDGIHPKFIKLILTYILPHVTHLLNTIVTTSKFPTIWKHAKIIPIPKSDKDYRPIAILPYLSKVFERLVHVQMSSYLYNNSLLTDRQSGFKPKHSCITTLVDVSEDIRAEMDNKKITFLVLLDHSKAFDTVDHSILCLKLKYMFNFSPTAIKLISSYLYGRSQSVYHGSEVSISYPVPRGVPQGSILGPLLYAIYSNDLPSQLQHCSVQMYADDVQLYISCKPTDVTNCIHKLNQDLTRIANWASTNGLCLNSKKSKAMIIGNTNLVSSILPPIQISNSPIEIVETARNLGVIFNKNLDWSDHINAICGKTFSMLRNLWMTQYYTPLNIRMLLAKTYLLPSLMYGCELFANSDSVSKKKLNVTFNNIARYVFGLKRFARISRYSRKLYNISFDNLLKCRSLILIHKIIYTKQPIYLYRRLNFFTSNRGKKIITIRHRTQQSKRHFLINSIALWNLLPHKIQTTSNAMQFKRDIFKLFG